MSSSRWPTSGDTDCIGRNARIGITSAVLAVMVLVPLTSRVTNAGHSSSAPANVVVFLTDDQRPGMIDNMPVVQRELVSRGITFTQAYATTPLCCPSRASILTGLYASHHGVLRNDGSRGGWRGFDDRSTIATWLQDRGVYTMLLGKYLNLYHAYKIPPGWDRWFAFWDTGKHYYDYIINDQGKSRAFGDKEQWYSSDVLSQQAVHFLPEEQDRPFFLYLSFDGPHAPAEPARVDRGRYAEMPVVHRPSFNEDDVSDKPAWIQALPMLTDGDQRQLDDFRRAQAETLQGVDRAIGTVIEALRADGRLENTWLVFLSDNSLSLGEHRYGPHKSCGYEECIRVPFIIVPPARFAAEARVPRTDAHLVLNIDVAPTVADLAGVIPGAAVDGRSLAPLVMDPNIPWRSETLLELWTNSDATSFRGLRSGSWKFLRYTNGEEELYDLSSDPFELQNLATLPEHRERLVELEGHLDARIALPPTTGK